MLFNSYVFVFLFFPMALIGYFLLNKWSFLAGKVFLLGMSLWFYGYFNWTYLPIIVVSICFNYTVGRLIGNSKGLMQRKIWLIIGVSVNIGLLFYYKYFDFFVGNLNSLFSTNFALKHLILPLGISFFTFQNMSYIIDSYWGDLPPYHPVDYALFVVYFPQLIAGPIVTHDEIIPQILDKTKKVINYENLSKGIMAFSFGLAKKVLIADTFARAVNWGYANSGELDSTNSLLIMLFYTFQIYFDFSGYCDMATGIGLTFNIDITQNFNSPYRALTIADFWKRWHITLTRFFTRYLYIPLGGNRKGKVRTYINIFIVFLVSGLWHGANWTFIVWGVVHGVFSLITKVFQPKIEKMYAAFNWLITFSFVNLAWIFFRADSVTQAKQIIGKIGALDFGEILPSIQNEFYLPEFTILKRLTDWQVLGDGKLYLVIFTLFALFAILFMKNTNERVATYKPTVVNSCVTIVLLVWSILSFAGVSTFLYFNF